MAATFRVEVDVAALERLTRRAPALADRALGALAFEGEGYIKNSFTVSPSSPGEPPGVDTGTLKNSIKSERIKVGEWKIETGQDVKYAAYLEFGTHRRDGEWRMMPRPFMGPAARYLGDISGKFFDGFLEK